MSSSQCLAILLIAAILHNWQLTNWRTDCTGCPLFLKHPRNCTEHKIILQNRIYRVSCHVFATFCAPNRAPNGSFRVQLFVLQIVLQMGLFACNFSCSKSCSRWVFSRATFCGPDRAPDGSFRVQLFVLQIVLQKGVSRGTFCAPNRAPDGCFRVQLFVLQIVLQMGLFACNFLWSRSVLQIGFFTCNFLCSMPFFNWSNYLRPLRARGSRTFFQNRVFFRECFCAINRVFFLSF